MADPYDLARFREAQSPVFDRVLAELHAGSKRTHWMWFVFPQIAGLGFSPMAVRFAISSVAEAQAYLADAELGGRLRVCVEAVLAHSDRSAEAILGGIDAIKFRSNLTLFREASSGECLFQRALDAFYGGAPDPATLALISQV